MANKYQKILTQLGEIRAVPATPEQLDDIEARLGYLLPDDYREFLLDYSECSFLSSNIEFPYIKDGDGALGSISMFYSANQSPAQSDIEGYYRMALEMDAEEIDYYPGISLLRSIEGIEEIGWPEELLPIGCDMGGSQICLALFGLRPHAIFYWMNSPCLGRQNVYLLANSFDEFMHLLQHNEA